MLLTKIHVEVGRWRKNPEVGFPVLIALPEIMLYFGKVWTLVEANFGRLSLVKQTLHLIGPGFS